VDFERSGGLSKKMSLKTHCIKRICKHRLLLVPEQWGEDIRAGRWWNQVIKNVAPRVKRITKQRK
jgi:hypothetical protein